MVRSREYQQALAEAMGLPIFSCIGLSLDIMHEDSIVVTATFTVTDEQLEDAARRVRCAKPDG